MKSVRARYDHLIKRIEMIYKDKLAGKIQEEFWFKKHEDYKQEQARINEWLRQHEKGNYDYVESGIEFLKVPKDAIFFTPSIPCWIGAD